MKHRLILLGLVALWAGSGLLAGAAFNAYLRNKHHRVFQSPSLAGKQAVELAIGAIGGPISFIAVTIILNGDFSAGFSLSTTAWPCEEREPRLVKIWCEGN